MPTREPLSPSISNQETRGLLREAVLLLQAAGVDSASLDAQILLAHASGLTRAELLAHPESRLSEEAVRRFQEWVCRREAREPLAYIIGEKEFYGLCFEVTQAVLIPRPETEVLVELVLSLVPTRTLTCTLVQGVSDVPLDIRTESNPFLPELRARCAECGPALAESPNLSPLSILGEGVGGEGRDSSVLRSPSPNPFPKDGEGGQRSGLAASPGLPLGSRPRRGRSRSRSTSTNLRDILVADIGTGSGAIAISIARNAPRAAVYGTDIYLPALDVARRNADRLGVQDRVRMSHGDTLQPLVGMEFDLIVSNPPYIPSDEIGRLQPEIAKYEPRHALDGGRDGLDCYRRLIGEAPAYLKPSGVLAVEVGAGQADRVVSLFRAADLLGVRTRRDYGGIERVVWGWRG